MKKMMPSTPNTVQLKRLNETVGVPSTRRAASDPADETDVRGDCLASCTPADGEALGTGDFWRMFGELMSPLTGSPAHA
jgi:hypothetical protein